MKRLKTAFGLCVAILVALLVPDYIGLTIGFSSFTNHQDLNRQEANQYLLLAFYCGIAVIVLVSILTAVALSLSRFASMVKVPGIVATALGSSLAVLHLGALYVGWGGLSSNVLDMFLARSADHAWMMLAASGLGLASLKLKIH